MAVETPVQGSLFSNDFLSESITQLPDWQSLDERAVRDLEAALRTIFAEFPANTSPNESQTEDDLIWPVLGRLGWVATLRQQNLAARGRDDVPDGLLFADAAAKTQANRLQEQWRRYGLGLAIVESKRWARPLDRRSGRRGEEIAPSTQMLRYLRRVEDMTEGKLRWGILTNGTRWRLYWQGARSVSEQFFEIDLALILDLPGYNDGLFALDETQRRHWLKVFALVFRCDSFLSSDTDSRSFHQRALDEGRFYEQRVAGNLSNLVFGDVFPKLVRAIATTAPEAALDDVREAALILLYRLLFLLYAEDRDLLPVHDHRYDDYGLRERVRGEVGRRKDRGDAFSGTVDNYWSAIQGLCRAVDRGDTAIGLPPYNGGLFDELRTPLLSRIRLPDAVLADVIDALSFERMDGVRKYINYRDLSVQQLGSIYERLLEHEVVRSADGIEIRPNIFARKNSGSYYTPDDLVGLILKETITPLVDARMQAFQTRISELGKDKQPEDRKIGQLKLLDPAVKLLDLKVCDPAMGSGHFLVSLVDMLADQVIAAMAEAEVLVEWGDYISPLSERIDHIRNTILANAQAQGWAVRAEQLDDRHIIRRMILKRCVYGVDKNPMAVELAKVSLWLHTFTVGAPLSFLDHHLHCGDSLFGSWVRQGIDKATKQGSPLLLHQPVTKATTAASSMTMIEGLTDAEIAEAHRSAELYGGIRSLTAPLDAFLSLGHAFDWLDVKDKEGKAAIKAFYDGQFGDPLDIALGRVEITGARPGAQRFKEILDAALSMVREERFLNWQVAFPGVWTDWQSTGLVGGFDAVIGNPPWDVYEFEDVTWFAARDRNFAPEQTDKARRARISQMQASNDELFRAYSLAVNRLAMGSSLLRSKRGDYSQLNKGKLNLYKLFVERGIKLLKPNGVLGLLTPSGISTDETCSEFFRATAESGRLVALYDFENRRNRYDNNSFFPDVDDRFKFCVFIVSANAAGNKTKCAFFLQDVSELSDADRCFLLSSEDFRRVNPNTGTAPIFRRRKDAELTTEIYKRLPVVHAKASGGAKTWPVRFDQMLNMTTDSDKFVTLSELGDIHGAWPEGSHNWRSNKGLWVSLYEGKMVQAFDHRAADIIINAENVFRPGQQSSLTAEEKRNPERYPTPRHYIQFSESWWKNSPLEWTIGFKDVTSVTNIRTMISAIIPLCGAGHTLPVLNFEEPKPSCALDAARICANLNALPFDYLARQKVQTNHFSNYILEQIPVVPLEAYSDVEFGVQSANSLVREIVLELTYTAHDMAPFARDLGYADKAGNVQPPFIWDDERRLHLRAKLDAIYFHLYGITDRDDVRYIYSTFPIVEREELQTHGRYLSRDLCLAWMNALAAGQPDAEIRL